MWSGPVVCMSGMDTICPADICLHMLGKSFNVSSESWWFPGKERFVSPIRVALARSKLMMRPGEFQGGLLQTHKLTELWPPPRHACLGALSQAFSPPLLSAFFGAQLSLLCPEALLLPLVHMEPPSRLWLPTLCPVWIAFCEDCPLRLGSGLLHSSP